ncbi:hypothetical protein [Ligilactobacillus animalis]|uniref:hypothetical protein n=1 Tax=Ligilactobacillus animalis TaxID=1605 RepID=UPI002A7545A0|nr:hypothetical protein [Ligilactobacillus animalis]MDY2994077.1 hypothetical protein [Ligilactobacillus animalis]
MNGWKEVLSIFAVTISVGLLIGMLLLINSTKKIDKSQQEIRQEKVTQAQSERSSESRSKASSTTVEVPEYETTYDTTEETAPAVENTGEYEIVGDPIDYTDAPGPQAPEWYHECNAKRHRTQYIDRVQTDKLTTERRVTCGSFICHTDHFYQDFENLGYISPEREAYLSSLQESYRQSSSD